ncbi:MAG TPA: leucyl/phenylalanyl-tRNA--protein transferase, partial [Chromatiales bacterium]|nr:leucyl/phenylalanyl-tRNA--protein transferase [Chromatiales bacterium]
DPGAPFPDVELAEAEPNGLLAIGGDLSPARLIQAYRQGIFPWYSEGQPILWWSPNPRTVLIPEELKVSRSLRKTLRRGHFTVTMDHAFGQVVRECAAPRSGESGTWLVPEMQLAYIELHREHIAHSVEVWRGETLVGGLYGVAFGQVFYGESMFSRETDASKVALVYLTQRLLEWGYRLIDCQVYTDHLIRLGAREIDRREFTAMLGRWADSGGRRGSWDLGPQETPPLAVMHQTRA